MKLKQYDLDALNLRFDTERLNTSSEPLKGIGQSRLNMDV